MMKQKTIFAALAAVMLIACGIAYAGSSCAGDSGYSRVPVGAHIETPSAKIWLNDVTAPGGSNGVLGANIHVDANDTAQSVGTTILSGTSSSFNASGPGSLNISICEAGRPENSSSSFDDYRARWATIKITDNGRIYTGSGQYFCESDPAYKHLTIWGGLDAGVAGISLNSVGPGNYESNYQRVYLTINDTSSGISQTLEIPDHSSVNYTLRDGSALQISICRASTSLGLSLNAVYADVKVNVASPSSLLPATNILDLNTSGKTYAFGSGYSCNLSQGITNCIVVTAPNVTIDCNGGTISASLETPMVAIYSNQSGTVVKNCRFKGFAGGISIVNASGSLLENNTFENEVNSMHESVRFAIQANSSTGIVVANNTVLLMNHEIIAEDQGLTFYTSIMENGVNDSSFYGNDLDRSLAGFYALNSHGNSFTSNSASSLMLSHSSSTSIEGNIFSFVPTSPGTIDFNGTAYRSGGWAQIFLVESDGNIVSGNMLGLADSGWLDTIALFGSNGNIVANNSIKNGGMTVSASSNNQFFGNNVTQGYEYGNALEISTTIKSSTGNVFSGNNLASKSASRPVIFTTSCTDPHGNPSVSQAANNTFFHNAISGALWVAEECQLPLNNYSFEGQGNAYYFPNGTASWDVYDIIDTDNDSYADIGSDLPFTQSTVGTYWHGPSEDAHPYTLKQGALPAIAQNSSAAASAPDSPPAPPSDEVSLPRANATAAEHAVPMNSTGAATLPNHPTSLLDEILASILDFLRSLNKI